MHRPTAFVDRSFEGRADGGLIEPISPVLKEPTHATSVSPTNRAKKIDANRSDDAHRHHLSLPKAESLMLTPEYSRQSVELGNRAIEISPLAVSEALSKLQVPADKVKIVRMWDREFHQNLVTLWNPPPSTQDDVRKIHRQVATLRRILDEKEIELLGLETANRFNELYSAAATRILQGGYNSQPPIQPSEPTN